MDAQRKSKIELTTSAEDWNVIRECYVKSFFRYPLYKYMVPDPNKREEFLRAYLNANYDVTVGTEQGILLAIKVLVENEEDVASYYKVVGGVVFVPPSSDGCGWAIGDDEPYWKAYQKHGLEKISKEGLERVKRYEAWENKHVAQKVSGSRIPLWNGLFCAIEPEFASKGVGSAVYKEAIRIMAKVWVKQQNSSKPVQVEETNKQPKQEERGFFSRIFRSSSSSFTHLHRCALLHHRAVPSMSLLQKASDKKPEVNGKKTNKKSDSSKSVTVKDMMFNPKAPLVVAVSHSDRAANFHQSNGFLPISRIPYHDNVEDDTPFYTHVLVLDPFSTGKMSELETVFQGDAEELKLNLENNFLRKNNETESVCLVA